MQQIETATVSFAPLNVVAVIRRCRHCGAVVAQSFRDGPRAQPHTCPPPPAPAMALAA